MGQACDHQYQACCISIIEKEWEDQLREFEFYEAPYLLAS